MPWIESVMNGGNETEKCVDSETSTPFPSSPVSATNDTRCGLQGEEPLINNSNVAYNGQFPWMVRITVTFWNRQNQTCLGTLIADQWIVTNANCVTFSNFQLAAVPKTVPKLTKAHRLGFSFSVRCSYRERSDYA